MHTGNRAGSSAATAAARKLAWRHLVGVIGGEEPASPVQRHADRASVGTSIAIEEAGQHRAALTGRVHAMGSISQTAARPSSAASPLSATLLFEPTVACTTATVSGGNPIPGPMVVDGAGPRLHLLHDEVLDSPLTGPAPRIRLRHKYVAIGQHMQPPGVRQTSRERLHRKTRGRHRRCIGRQMGARGAPQQR